METDIQIPEIDCLRRTSLIKEVDLITNGHVRMETGFFYPDGSSVDLFLKNENDLFSDIDVVLTDFGNSISWLNMLGVDPFKSQKKSKIIKNILQTYGIWEEGGCLECRIDINSVADGIVRLGQACLRVADLSYTVRFAPQSLFAEEVEEVLDETGLPYERTAKILGREHNVVKVDFKVRGPRTESALMLLPAETRSETAARQKAEHVFSALFDLQNWPGQRIAVLDDRKQIYPDADISRIETTALVVPFSDRESFSDILLAA